MIFLKKHPLNTLMFTCNTASRYIELENDITVVLASPAALRLKVGSVLKSIHIYFIRFEIALLGAH